MRQGIRSLWPCQLPAYQWHWIQIQYGNFPYHTIQTTTIKPSWRAYEDILSSLMRPQNGRNARNKTMKVTIKANVLTIEIDMQKPTPSASGKTLVVASTHGNQPTTAMIDGKPIIIGLNAYIRNAWSGLDRAGSYARPVIRWLPAEYARFWVILENPGF